MPFIEESLDWPLSKVLPILQKRIMEQTTYHGIPMLKNPLDFWIYQEIIWETRPDIIIEIGNLYGGGTLALAHICDTVGRGQIIAVDSNHDQIDSRVRSHPRIKLVTGDASEVFPVVQRMISSRREIQEAMVIEDSLHTYDNTLSVLNTYNTLVGAGKYFIVEDGICHHGLDIGPKPGPYEAVEAFAITNKNFIVDRSREAFGITWNPKGFLKRIQSA